MSLTVAEFFNGQHEFDARCDATVWLAQRFYGSIKDYVSDDTEEAQLWALVYELVNYALVRDG